MSMDVIKTKGKPFVDSEVDGAQRRLEELGYRQELNRNLSITGNVVMALSNVSPLMAAFVYALAAFATVGIATAPAALIQGFNVILIGFIIAELGSIYPVSGGLYSIISYILPKPLVFVAVFTFMIQAFIYPPSIALGVGQYLQILFPQLPQSVFATSVIAAITFIAALFIGLNSIVTNNRLAKILLLLQLLVIAVFLVVCFANPQRSLGDIVFSPQMLDGQGSGLTPAGFGAVLMGIGILCASIDGYPASLGFSEETKGSCRNIGKAALISAVSTAVLIVIVLIMSMIAAPDLQQFLTAPSPLLYTAETYLGALGSTLVNVGIIIASFSCLVVIINYMARVIYTGGRDGIWPKKINEFLTKVSSKSQIPWAATTLIAVVGCFLVFYSNLVVLVIYGGLAAATVYLLLAIGSINSRRKDPEITRPFRMPLFPIPSILVILFLIIAIGSQTPDVMLAVGIFIILALVYYYAYIRPRDMKGEKTSE
ncbi:APC family permease [Sinanaerobacter chloroacetimidivorans]|uniref:APC family permease n=1 Tax=Sinanaerobacter chloroacetimidivorans TaxID=2818044 RepID=A0A8J8B3A6_9FIRM|nr:APC family permease [Sinanaerobacter chloroacetimidivorans]MBR0599557.1 APC family permease [Sinanaerobacter chloroacetimidivorans]